jgi:hypothetical protein
MSLKSFIKTKLTDTQLKTVKHYFNLIKSVGKGNNLNKLARIYKTDKGGEHLYTQHYMTHFKKYRLKRINLLESGVGGEEYPKLGGASLRLWKRFFPFGNIFAIDIYDKCLHEENRIKIFKGDQNDKLFLMDLVKKIPKLDIIIDDGSHINKHVIETFKILFPYIKLGGLYVIEDTQTSYWPDFGGDSIDLNNSDTIMNYFKKLTDCLNYREFLNADYQPTFLDKNIVSIHFYHNLIFIYKGENEEESNMVKNNQR